MAGPTAAGAPVAAAPYVPAVRRERRGHRHGHTAAAGRATDPPAANCTHASDQGSPPNLPLICGAQPTSLLLPLTPTSPPRTQHFALADADREPASGPAPALAPTASAFLPTALQLGACPHPRSCSACFCAPNDAPGSAAPDLSVLVWNMVGSGDATPVAERVEQVQAMLSYGASSGAADLRSDGTRRWHANAGPNRKKACSCSIA